MTHQLDKALAYIAEQTAIVPISDVDRLGYLAQDSGHAAWEGDDRKEDLAACAGLAIEWMKELRARDPHARIREKHNQYVSVPMRPFIAGCEELFASKLIVMVGMAANCFRQENNNIVCHTVMLTDALTNVATTAAAWLARILENEEAAE